MPRHSKRIRFRDRLPSDLRAPAAAARYWKGHRAGDLLDPILVMLIVALSGFAIGVPAVVVILMSLGWGALMFHSGHRMLRRGERAGWDECFRQVLRASLMEREYENARR